MIELLVVISIIGILATLVFVSFTSSQKQARDTQRKSDLAQYRNSLESFANKGVGLYPVSTAAISNSTLCTSSYLNLEGCSNDPRDPTTSYSYCSDTGGIKYALWASLESVESKYWVVCSDGRSGVSSSIPSCGGSFNCNLP